MGWQEDAFAALSGARGDDGGLSEGARAHEPANFLRHAASLTLSKSADGLVDAKLVLSWLLTQLGASSSWVGLLVPIREAGALLPQLWLAPRLHAFARRKWAWALAALGQAVAAAAILVSALSLRGERAGLAVCCAVAWLALARSLASVTYKDVLGKTVGKQRRGAATGLAASASSVAVILFALALMAAPVQRRALVLGALGVAAVSWGLAGLIFASLHEVADPKERRRGALGQLQLLRHAPALRRFVYARGLLTGTALAPPYLIVLGAQAGSGTFEALGASVLASAGASLVSSYVWGRLADRSSRTVLALSGLCGAAALLLAVMLDGLGLAGSVWAVPLSLFLLMVCYHGVRQGRATYLVDLAPDGQRAAYTAVANTAIGVLLLASGALGAALSAVSAQLSLVLFAALAAAGSFVAFSLEEVEHGVG